MTEKENDRMPVEAEIEGDGRSTWFFVCGECHGIVDTGDHFCRNCGREILWVGVTSAKQEGGEKDGDVHG